MGQSNGVLFREVSGFWRCPLIEVSLYFKIKEDEHVKE